MSAAAKNVPKLTADSVKKSPFKTGGSLKTETFSFTGKFDQYVISIQLRPAPTGQALTDCTAEAVKHASKLQVSEQGVTFVLTPPYPIAVVSWNRDQSIPRQTADLDTSYTVYAATRTNTAAATATATATGAAAASTATGNTTATGAGGGGGTATASTSCYVLRPGFGGSDLKSSSQTRDSLIELLLAQVAKSDVYRAPQFDCCFDDAGL